LNRKRLINGDNKDVLKIVQSLYIHLDFLKPDLFSAQRMLEELENDSGLLIFKNEYSGKQYTDNPMFIARKIKEHFLEEL